MNFSKVYDRLAQTYDLALGPLLRHGHKLGIHAMNLKPGMRFLEAGIGTGLTLTKIPSGIEIVGIDLSEPMLKKAEKRVKDLGLKNVSLHVMSAEAMEFKDNSFDAVFAPSVFSVVNHPRKVLDEMVRVCRPDGVICIIAHFAGSTWPEKMTDEVFDPLTQKLFGFRMKTPREIVESHPGSEIVLKKPVLSMNFGTLYLLKKKVTG